MQAFFRLLFACSILAVSGFTVSSPALAWERTLIMSQMGSAAETNKQQAHDEAYQQAADTINNICVGTVQDVEETGASYIPIGSGDNTTYSATVFVRAHCVMTGNR